MLLVHCVDVYSSHRVLGNPRHATRYRSGHQGIQVYAVGTDQARESSIHGIWDEE